jgi:hypothetical protein
MRQLDPPPARDGLAQSEAACLSTMPASPHLYLRADLSMGRSAGRLSLQDGETLLSAGEDPVAGRIESHDDVVSE